MLYIFRGDDTAFAEFDRKVCIRLDTFKDLTGWSAKFKLVDNEKVFTDISSRLITFGYTAEETEEFPIGQTYGKLSIFDQSGKVRQIVQVEVEIMNKRPESGICGTIAISVDNVLADYNNIGNKPTINGVTVEGDHDSAHYKLAGLDVVAANAETIACHSAQICDIRNSLQTTAATVADQGVAIANNSQNIQMIKASVAKATDDVSSIKQKVDDVNDELTRKISREESARKEEDNSLSDRIDKEADARAKADREIRSDLEDVRNNRITDKSRLEQLINAEKIERQSDVQTLSNSLEAEAKKRDSGDKLNSDKIDSVANQLEKKIDTVAGNVSDARNDLAEDLKREAAVREKSDSSLLDRIDAAVSKASSDLASEAAIRKQIADKDRQDFKEAIAVVTGKLDAEVKSREATDGRLLSEGTARIKKDNELESKIDSEIQDRKSEDTRVLDEAKAYADAIGSRALHYRGQVETESDLTKIESPSIGDMYNVKDTGANYAWDGTKWDKLSETIDLSPYAKKEDVENAIGGLNTDLSEEVKAREDGDSALDTKIGELRSDLTTETSDRKTKDTELQSNIDNEKTARENADTNLGGRIDNETKAREDAVSGESKLRMEADDAINKRVSDEISDRQTAFETAETNRKNADDILDGKITAHIEDCNERHAALVTDLAAETKAREDGDAKTLSDAKAYADTVGAKAMHFKGSVKDRAALEAITDMAQGDMYNVDEYLTDSGETIKGANFAWTGVRWDKLSETIDLSPFAKKVDVNATTNGLDGRLKTVEDSLATVKTTADRAEATANRAEGKADTNKTNLETEVTRATNRENEIAKLVSDEELRAKGIEGTLDTSIKKVAGDLATESATRESEDTRVLDAAKAYCDTKGLDVEDRLTELGQSIAEQATTISFWSNKINANEKNIQAEIERATGIEDGLRSDLTTETNRATNAEETLDEKLDDYVTGQTAITKLKFSSTDDSAHDYELQIVLVDDGDGGMEPSLQLVQVDR